MHTSAEMDVYNCMKFFKENKELFDRFKNENTKTRQENEYLYSINNLSIVKNNTM